MTLETIDSSAVAAEVTSVVDRLLDDIDGELTSRSRAVDGLLDLRLAADGASEFTDRIDGHLSTIPGISTVANQWWMEVLADIRTATDQ